MIIFIAMIAIITGIMLGLYLKISIALIFLCLFLLIIVYCICLKKINKVHKKIKFRKVYILIFIIILVASNLYILLLEKYYNTTYLNVDKNVKIIGTIVSNEIDKEYKKVYKIKVESINDDNNYKNTYLLLNIKNSKSKNNLFKFGDKIKFNGEYEIPSEQRNYKGFDYKQYLKTQKIHGIVNTENKSVFLIKNNNINFISLVINKCSNTIKNNINKIFSRDEASLLLGILLGDKQNLSEEIEENFKNSNLSHMLAVSGAHVSYIILGFNFIINKIKISRKSGKIYLIIFLIFFAILTNASPSILRTTIMTIYLLLGKLLHRKSNVLVSVSLSAILILLSNPYYIFNVGFLLSFMGTVGIIFLYKPLDDKVNKMYKLIKDKINIPKLIDKIVEYIKTIILVTISANIMIFPITLINYNTLSLTFIISNLLTSTLFGIIVILGFFTIFLSFLSIKFAAIIAWILNLFLKLLNSICEFTSNIPLSKVYIKTPFIFTIIFYYIFIFAYFYYINQELTFKKKIKRHIKRHIKKSLKKIIIFIIIFLILFSIIKITPSNLKIYFIDVGQGDSSLIITPTNKKILIDGGGSENGSFDVGKQVLMPYLLNRRIDVIDYCLISHFDSDHCRTEY